VTGNRAARRSRPRHPLSANFRQTDNRCFYLTLISFRNKTVIGPLTDLNEQYVVGKPLTRRSSLRILFLGLGPLRVPTEGSNMEKVLIAIALSAFAHGNA